MKKLLLLLLLTSSSIFAQKLTKEQLDMVMYGTGSKIYNIALGNGRNYETTFEGVVSNLERRYKETESDFVKRDIQKFMQELPCHSCHGKRLKPEVLAVTINKFSISTNKIYS